MLTAIYCTRSSNPQHKEHIIKTSGLHNKIEVIEIINNGEESLTKSFNKGLEQATNKYVVFLHDDVEINTKQWGVKLIKLFEKNEEYGIIGVAGTKYLSKSGQWWENRDKMYGRVSHSHDGKTWLSEYSKDLGHEIEPVVIVDGVFFAVNKDKIIDKFDESVEGYHFYDVTFCFQNYINNVKIGVTTLIKLTHNSIGMTNESWENNRKDFSEKYHDQLPINIKKTFNKNNKLRVLIGCLNFNNYTGSELYVLELAKELIKQNCEVSICSTIGNPLAKIATSLGIKLYSLQEPPGFKLGDGNWKLKSADGEILSQPNTLYKLQDIKFDVIHLNHKPVTEHLMRLYGEIPIISSIHSEVISLEEPIVSSQIKKYIAIRPQIKDYLINNFSINENDIEVIYNPIDTSRFNTNNNTLNKVDRVLFVGTIDYLRRNTIADLIRVTKEENKELWIVGKENDNYLPDMILGQDHVKYFTPTNNVEQYIKQCSETAGVLLGRTTIEGWMCGKKGWIYDIDKDGNILSKSLHDIPNDISKFDSRSVASETIKQYLTIID